MQEPTFLILTALADRAQHGYGIMRDAKRISDGRVRLRAGTLYAALDRLRADGSSPSTVRKWSRGACAATTASPTKARPSSRRRSTSCAGGPRSPPGGWRSSPASAPPPDTRRSP
jgi:hypothetical protein